MDWSSNLRTYLSLDKSAPGKAAEDSEREIMQRDRELTVELGESPSVDDLLDHLGYLPNIDETKKETIKMIVKSQIIKVPRQLEHWHIINVYAVDLRARCICKKCNCDGCCYWVDTFESIEFGLQPTIAQMPGKDPTVGYQGMVWQAVEMIKHMNVRR